MTASKTTDAPRDRMIEAHVREAGIWLRVKWDPDGVTDVDGLATVTGRWEGREQDRSSFWLGPDDVDDWREPSYPPLKVSPLDPSADWDTLASRLLNLDAATPTPGPADRDVIRRLFAVDASSDAKPTR